MRSFGKLFAAMSFAMVVTNINSESKNKKGNTHYTCYCYDVRNKQGTQHESKRHDYQKIDRPAKGLLGRGENAVVLCLTLL